jgi:hypothetical protein
MRTLLISVFFAALATGFIAEASESVSMIQLIANPAQYHGKKVIVSGFLNIEFEGTAIYLHRDDYAFSQYRNGLWCTMNETLYRKYNRRYVIMEGVFNRDMRGHLGLWSGSIEKIERVWEPHVSKQGGK